MNLKLFFSAFLICFFFTSHGQQRPKIDRIFVVSPTSANFSAEGGAQVFEVKSTYPWYISVNTNSWSKLSRSGNVLVLNVAENAAQTPRTDYFELKSGDNCIRISISQDGGVNPSNELRTQKKKSNDYYDIACNRLLTESDLTGLSAKELRIMRNWIYARHGYIFRRKELQNYFAQFDWYHPQYSEIPYHKLSSIEQKNIEFIKLHE